MGSPSDQLRQILAAHGVSADTVSLTGPRTLLGEELERMLREENGRGYDAGKANGGRMALRAAEEWKARAWGALRDAESILARHRRHLARLRWRREHHEPHFPVQRDRLSERVLVEKAWGKGRLHLSRWCRMVPIAGPFPGDGTRPAGRLP